MSTYDSDNEWDWDARHTKNSLKDTELNLLLIEQVNKLLDTVSSDIYDTRLLPPKQIILENHWICFDEKFIGRLIDRDYSVVVDTRRNPAVIKIGFEYYHNDYRGHSDTIIIRAGELYARFMECFRKRCDAKKRISESPFQQSLFDSCIEAKYESRFDPRDRRFRQFRNYYITYTDECKYARQYDYKKPEVKSELTDIQQFDLIWTIRTETIRLISEHSIMNNTLTVPIVPTVPESTASSETIGDTEYCQCSSK